MSSILKLQEYNSDSDSDMNFEESVTQHLKPEIGKNESVVSMEIQNLVVAPNVTSLKELDDRRHIDPTTKELSYNPKFNELFAPVIGPQKEESSYHEIKRNILSGHVEQAHLSAFDFEVQRRTFHTYGK